MKNKLTDNDVQKTIPASVSQYNRQPLYIIIALWCQQQNRWINRNDIAQAFSISVRRASFQLSYITRRQKKIIFRIRRQVISHHPCNEIWVKNVIMESLSGTTKKTPPLGNKSKPCNMGAYRSRVGNGMSPGENVWHKLVMIRKTEAKEEDC
ncbi:CaiF/GrlA family transcriptional regulator [Salmonella enterica subsp. enterica serovar Thompson]|nr:CaiF/GrlA family transcriptional regulator [Salmonella enterica subsp. enterica serovar Thompson]EHF1242317.1 CaiF/GrlA family transcriptional regulator [Salmonella enterica]EBV8143433.1 CaiF/GrlA family transcriptional regulator [Salmonella enterica subsp. enterica serovar Thompson]EDY1281276.1 CaiF/GrlA family transcriptional regulator [Salmonella enterica subsp. enterica serovar Thompson]EED9491882.1 CaiF/GrlA family transcriptional regulator [Salmonella enterica subsp. enterica serovar T